MYHNFVDKETRKRTVKGELKHFGKQALEE